MFTYILIAVIFILAIIFRWRYRKFFALSKILKHDLPTLPILGSSHLFFGDAEDRMNGLFTMGRELLKRDGIYCVWIAHHPFLGIGDPELAEYLSRMCLEKHFLLELVWKIILGNSVIIAPVPIWRPRRKILMPTFTLRNMKHFTKIFAEQSATLVKQLRETTGQPISMFEHVIKYSLESVCQTVLGVQLDAQTTSKQHNFAFAISEFMRLTGDRILQPWLYPDFIYRFHPSYKMTMRCKKCLEDFTNEVIKQQRLRIVEDKNKKEDTSERFKSFLELLIESSGGERGYSDQELFEETVTLIVAGTDTSAVGSSFVALLLARHPDVQEKIYEELKQVVGDEDVTSESLPSLKYLNAVIREALRLYTPVPGIIRKVDKDVTLPSGVVVPKGCGIAIHLWAINRNPRYWGADAEEFRPERFLDSNFKHAAQYASFSLGPRNCPGYQYAITSTMTLFASIVRHYRIVPVPGTRDEAIRLKFGMMMKDVNNFMIQLEPRK